MVGSALCWKALGDLAEGAQNLDQYTHIYPADDWGWGALSDAYIQIGAFPQAIATAQHVLQYGVYRQEVLYEDLIRALFRANCFTEAKRAIAKAQAQGKMLRICITCSMR